MGGQSAFLLVMSLKCVMSLKSQEQDDDWDKMDDGYFFDDDSINSTYTGGGLADIGDDFFDDDDTWDESSFNQTAYDTFQSHLQNQNLTSCSPLCPPAWIDDGFCDPGCNNTQCNFDGEDCGVLKTAQVSMAGKDDDFWDDDNVNSHSSNSNSIVITECAPGCHEFMINDGICDADCNVDACEHDAGDCDKSIEGECSESGCAADDLGDGFCDASCNNAACSYDRGDCDPGSPPLPPIFTSNSTDEFCSDGCPSYFIGDDICDNECNNAACQFDLGDCSQVEEAGGGTSSSSGDCICPDDWLGDRFCDDECNTAECQFDRGDCQQEPEEDAEFMDATGGGAKPAFSAVRITKKGSGGSNFTLKDLPPLAMPSFEDLSVKDPSALKASKEAEKEGKITLVGAAVVIALVGLVLYRRTKLMEQTHHGHVILPTGEDDELLEGV